MNLGLHQDWRTILRRAWSVRFMALSAVLSGIAAGLTIAQPYLGVNPVMLAVAIGVVTTAAPLVAIFARVVKQEGLSDGP